MNGKRKQTIKDAFVIIRDAIAGEHPGCPKLDIEYVEIDNTILCETKAKEKKLVVNIGLIGKILQRKGSGSEDIEAAKGAAAWLYAREMYFVLQEKDHTLDYMQMDIAGSIAAFKQGYAEGEACRENGSSK